MGTNATQTGAAQWIEENVVNVELLWALMSQRSERCLYIKHLTRKYRPVFVCGCTIITLPKTFYRLIICLFIYLYFFKSLVQILFFISLSWWSEEYLRFSEIYKDGEDEIITHVFMTVHHCQNIKSSTTANQMKQR